MLLTYLFFIRYVVEDGHKSNTTICRNTEKEQHVYTSNGRNMVIDITSGNGVKDSPQFMLHYNGKSIISEECEVNIIKFTVDC